VDVSVSVTNHQVKYVLNKLIKGNMDRESVHYASRGIYEVETQEEKIKRWRKERKNRLVENAIRQGAAPSDSVHDYLDVETDEIDEELEQTLSKSSFVCNLGSTLTSFDTRFEVVMGILVSIATFRPEFQVDTFARTGALHYLFDFDATVMGLNAILVASGKMDRPLPKVKWSRAALNATGNATFMICDNPKLKCFHDQSLRHTLSNFARQFTALNGIASARCVYRSKKRRKTFWDKGLLHSSIVSSLNRAFVLSPTLVKTANVLIREIKESEYICAGSDIDLFSVDFQAPRNRVLSQHIFEENRAHFTFFHFNESKMEIIVYNKGSKTFSKRDIQVPSSQSHGSDAHIGTIAWTICSLSRKFLLNRHTASHFGVTAMMHRCGPLQHSRCKFYDAIQNNEKSSFESLYNQDTKTRGGQNANDVLRKAASEQLCFIEL
jgi:hypothetical protein